MHGDQSNRVHIFKEKQRVSDLICIYEFKYLKSLTNHFLKIENQYEY